ncbi:MAG: DUF2155 domain-containing protein [Phenylobacterium sp.]|uniref:DUF2155 domain-containing protein n=1 Tax=Phenylobacterium sp. TaxID=1871053 RepID=UPI00391978C8
MARLAPFADRRTPLRGAAAAVLALIAAGGALAQTAAQPAAPAPGAQPSDPAPAQPAPTPPVVLPPEEEIPPAVAEAPPAAEPKAAAPEPPPKPEPPAKRARYDVAVLQALDKITAETVRFEAAVGKPVRYKSLVFTVRACERSTEEEATPDAIAYLTIESQPKAAPGKPTPAARQAFRGWMYASSPGLNPLEHPVYDAWLITCRAAAPS